MPLSKKIPLVLMFLLTLSGCEFMLPQPPAETKEDSTTPLTIAESINDIPQDLITEEVVAPNEPLGIFSDASHINEIESKSGKYKVNIKRYKLNTPVIIQDSFETNEIKKLPIDTPIRFELVLTDLTSGTESIIDTYKEVEKLELAPFFLGDFVKDEEYFEYSKSTGSSTEFKLFDLINKNRVPIELTGLPNERIWFGDYYFVCSHGGFDNNHPSAVIIKPPYWKIDEQLFMYPTITNQSNSEFYSKKENLTNLSNPTDCKLTERNFSFTVDGEEDGISLYYPEELQFNKNQGPNLLVGNPIEETFE